MFRSQAVAALLNEYIANPAPHSTILLLVSTFLVEAV
jgi:hypothetical protein